MPIDCTELWQEAVRTLLANVAGAEPERLDIVPLSGGLESAVALVRIRFAGNKVRSVVVKRLDGIHRREAAIHALLGSVDAAPLCLGSVESATATYLVLEYVRPQTRWPWRRVDNTRLAMRQLAQIHSIEVPASDFPGWDYDRELLEGARLTLRTAQEHVSRLPEISLRSNLRSLSRFAERMPAIRKQLGEPFGKSLIHGDAHPGNAILRIRGGRPQTIFIDWARSRIASPLEDVSSWLQTLRYWEPSAARRHDTLLRDYLEARGDGMAMTRDLRDAYWSAAGSNVMAGALRFQILRASESRGRERVKALEQASEWLRVIRRADACTSS